MPNSGLVHVLVLGVGGTTSQGILKALELSSVPMRLYGACVSPRALGLYAVDEAHICPPASDPDFTLWLRRFVAENRIDIVYSGVEEVLRTLAHMALDLRHMGCETVVSDAGALRICDHKTTTCKWLKVWGLNHPAFADVNDPEGVRKLVLKYGYPLAAKPWHGKGSKGFIIIRDGADLARVPAGYVVQEYLGHIEHADEYTVGGFVGRDGVVHSVVMQRTLQDGLSVWADAGNYPEVRAEAERVIGTLKPFGPCNVQMRMHQGKPTTFEINARYSGTTPIRAALGWNDVDAALRHFVLREPVSLPQHVTGIAARYWQEAYLAPADVQALARDGRATPQRVRLGAVERERV
jgi:carbamoyl-phosphate synthase large subunit